MEKKGLFGRMLEFFREKISMGETGGIGFWNDGKSVENHFAEMGAVASLSQRETKQAFWDAMGNESLQQKEDFFMEGNKEEKNSISAASEKEKKGIFTAEIFREERQAEAEEGMGRTFLWEMPADEKETRSIVPVTAEPVQETEKIAEEEKMPEKEMTEREERRDVPAVDIDSLMRQMTKKLWEEREGCGRRLR